MVKRQAKKCTKQQDPQQQHDEADLSGSHHGRRRLIAKLQHSVNPRVICKAFFNQVARKDVIDPLIVQCCSPMASFSLAFDRLTRTDNDYNVDVEVRDVDVPNCNHLALQIEATVEWFKRPANTDVSEEMDKSMWPAPEPPVKVTLDGEGRIGSFNYDTLRALTVHLDVYALDGCSFSSVRDCLNTLRLEKTLTNVELKVDGKSFSAHRAVLAANSSVFSSMFTNDIKESQEVIVEIEGASSTAFGRFLQFIYTANLDDWKGCEIELLELAERYLVATLKAVCEEHLVSHPLLALTALRHVDKPFVSSGLRAEAMRLVAKNLVSVANTQQWEDFKASSPVLADAIREAQEGVVEIDGLSSTAFAIFLEYLYTARVSDWKGCEVELLELADRYLVDHLKAVCEERLLSLPHLALSVLLHDDKPWNPLAAESIRLAQEVNPSVGKSVKSAKS